MVILRQGIEDVLAQRRQLTATLRDQIVAHDVARDRELDAVLRSVERGLATWMDQGSARDRLPLGLLPATAEVGTLRERFYDPDAESVPPAIEEPDDDVFEELDVETLRRHGGPLLTELRAALRSASADSSVDAFHGLPPEQRRPVELFGLAHLLTAHDDFESAAHLAEHRTVRPDGSPVTFHMPTAALTDERRGPEPGHDERRTRTGGAVSDTTPAPVDETVPYDDPAAVQQDDERDETSFALFEGDEGRLDDRQRRALVALLRSPYVSARTHTDEWRAVLDAEHQLGRGSTTCSSNCTWTATARWRGSARPAPRASAAGSRRCSATSRTRARRRSSSSTCGCGCAPTPVRSGPGRRRPLRDPRPRRRVPSRDGDRPHP